MASPRRLPALPVSHSPLHELDTYRLQRTVDTVSIKYEQECRRDILLTEQIRIMEEELKRRKEAAKPDTTVTEENRLLQTQIATLSHELHLAALKVGEIQTRNKTLRGKIEACRRDLEASKHAIQSLTGDIARTARTATVLNVNNCEGSLATIQHKNVLEQVRSKSVAERVKQTRRIQELVITLRDDTSPQTTTFLTAYEEENKRPTRRAFDLVDPIPIQRALGRKWKDVLLI